MDRAEKKKTLILPHILIHISTRSFPLFGEIIISFLGSFFGGSITWRTGKEEKRDGITRWGYGAMIPPT